jgi:5-carboxyvanillate decarboxylase
MVEANRRAILGGLASAALLPGVAASQPRPPTRLRKIATEEAFMAPEFVEPLRAVIAKGGPSLDLPLLKLLYEPRSPTAPAPEAGSRDASALQLLPKLLDIGASRLAEMDASGVDMHVLSIAMPGPQMFEPAEATALARVANDHLRAAMDAHPTRFAGLGCFAPQEPSAAAKEMERAITTLKLNGLIINSHTDNLYLDDERFAPILEAAEALGAPLYIHPRAPSDGMAGPLRDYRLEGATWGYGLEVGTHVLRLMLSGTLDRFPKLKIVIGHMGEALPFWLWRLDFMAQPGSRAGRKNKLTPSEYMARNIWITTSGVEDPAALRFCIDKLGADRIMWAIDHPFQPTPPAVRFIETAPLSESERARIAHRNAEIVFKIDPA